MDFVQYQTGIDDEDRRIDRVLRILFPDTPLSLCYSYIRKGLIRVNQKKIKQDYHIQKSDVIQVAAFLDLKCAGAGKPSSAQTTSSAASSAPSVHDQSGSSPTDVPQVIFRNEHILIINKPYDIPVHGSSGYTGRTVEELVRQYFTPDRASLSFRPGPLHRLDRKTTGLLAFSQSILGAHEFSRLFEQHDVHKTYLAVLCGNVEKSMTFRDFISKNSESNAFHTVQAQSSEKSDSKSAITTVQPVCHGVYCGKDITFCQVVIETGRTHQIRSQCALHGFPLLGDTAYGGQKTGRMYLHAWKLSFPPHNTTGIPEQITAPVPDEYGRFLKTYLPHPTLQDYTSITL